MHVWCSYGFQSLVPEIASFAQTTSALPGPLVPNRTGTSHSRFLVVSCSQVCQPTRQWCSHIWSRAPSGRSEWAEESEKRRMKEDIHKHSSLQCICTTTECTCLVWIHYKHAWNSLYCVLCLCACNIWLKTYTLVSIQQTFSNGSPRFLHFSFVPISTINR